MYVMKNSLLDRFLKGFAGVEVLILLIAMSAMDSDDLTVPIALMAQSIIWLGAVGSKLDWDDDEDYEDEDPEDDEGEGGGGLNDADEAETSRARRKSRCR